MDEDPKGRDNPHKQLDRIAERFAEHGVEFVIIGGWSIDKAYPELQYATDDIDFVVASTAENYERIAAVLKELEVRQSSKGIERKELPNLDPEVLRGREHWRFESKAGTLDIMSSAGMISGYEVLIDTARPVPVSEESDVEVFIADPKIVYVSKQFANREKDRRILPRLLAAITSADGPAGVEAVGKMSAAVEHAMEVAEPWAIDHMDAVIRERSASIPIPPRQDAGESTTDEEPSKRRGLFSRLFRRTPSPEPEQKKKNIAFSAGGIEFSHDEVQPGGNLGKPSGNCGRRTLLGFKCKHPHPGTGGRCSAGHRH